MTGNTNLWEARKLPSGLTLELRAGANPSLVLLHGDDRISVALNHVKALVATLVDGAADLAEVVLAGLSRPFAFRAITRKSYCF